MGGGRTGDLAASNSFDALGANIDRFTVFELDLEWTAEGELVCIDDWQQSFEARFGVPISTPPDHNLFRQLLAASPDAPRNCQLDELAGWLRANPRIRIVTDVTEKPVAAHALIAERHPDLRAQFVPQAIRPEQITALRELGFDQVIWAPEASLASDAIITEARNRTPTALALTLDAARDGALQALSSGTRLPVYIRSSNDPGEIACLMAEGAAGVFSDDLESDQVDVLDDLPARCLAEAAPFTPSIGHGGGRLDGVVKTNSYGALNANIDRFEVFELDFEWTADGELVCIHDWEISYTTRFGTPTETAPDHATFQRRLAGTPDAPRNCDLDGLADWMRAHPDIRIVTDVKSNPVAAHELIGARHPDLMSQFVPQAYQPQEVTLYRSMGFDRVIWTLYQFGDDPEKVIREALAANPNAITMPQAMADAGLLQAVIEATDFPVYVHTINDPQTASCLLARGASGIYSDDLAQAEVKDIRATAANCS